RKFLFWFFEMELKVHVCKLSTPTAVHIRSVSVESDLQKLALTRSDSSVEVWDCHKNLSFLKGTGVVYTSGIDSLICQYQCMETTESSRKRHLDGETKLADFKKITFIESKRQRFQPTTVGSLVKENSWLLSAGVGATMYQIMDNGERHLYKPFHPMKDDRSGLKVSLKKLKLSNDKLQPADALCFINVKSTEICVLAANGVLSFVAIEKFRLSLKFKIELIENSLCSVRKLVQSWDDRFLAAITSHNDILVIDVTTKSVIFIYLCLFGKDFVIEIFCIFFKIVRAPNKMLCPVDLKFSSEEGTVVILFSSGHVLEFYPKTRKCTPLCTSNFLEPQKVPQWSRDCFGVAASKYLPNTIILYGDKKLSFLRKNSQNMLQAGESVSHYGNCWFCDIMSDGDLLVVEIDKDRYNAQLPALFKLQKFGRK
ncbi:hypothetical protein Tsp_00473, partial [Trichinella spiralis]|uniref:hypothetical protein n=1 Tax=Trichinella spiralis TaxID=6334 RepID=UPI0001EFB88B